MSRHRPPAGVVMLGAALALAGCGDGVQPPTGGWVDVVLLTPNTDDGGIVFTVGGAAIDSIRSRWPDTFMRRESASAVRVVVVGTLSAGPVAQVRVPDVGALRSYTVEIVEVASRTYDQRPPAGYDLVLEGPTS